MLYPEWFFELSGMPAPRHMMIWQGMGMVIGLYGLGYWWASYDLVRHWPNVVVGFLGKIFGPIVYVWGLTQGTAHPAFGYTLITNDLIWWNPFALMLRIAWREHLPLSDDKYLLTK